MIDRATLARLLARLARAAPGAFRHDPVFRTAAIGAVVALLMLAGRLGGREGAVPPPAPPPATLGASYGEPSGPAVPAPASAGPIAPSRSLEGIHVRRDPNGPADRFGRFEAGSASTSRDEVPAARPQRKTSDDQP